MRTFKGQRLDLAMLGEECDALQALLERERHLKEREHVLDFFKNSPQIATALGLFNSAAERPNCWARELDLFGDFVCDVAAGDRDANAFTLVEFEDALEFSIFKRLGAGKVMRRWSPGFEGGFSQLVDWAWRLSGEGGTSAALRRIVGNDEPSIHFLLVVGRDADLSRDDLKRLRWRANHVGLGAYRMSCFTFDGLLQSIRRRLLLAEQSAGE